MNGNGNGNGHVWRAVYTAGAGLAAFLLLWNASRQQELAQRLDLIEARLNARIEMSMQQQREDRMDIAGRLEALSDKLAELYRTLLTFREESR